MKKILKLKPLNVGGDRENFKNSVCVLAISMGQKSHEGENLAATIDFINENFKSCVIVLGDTLQRFNFKFLYSLDLRAAYKKAMKEGESWLQRNRVIFSKLKIPYVETRWEEWRNHEAFKKLEKTLDEFLDISDLDKSDQELIAAFQKSAENFTERFTKILKEWDIEITEELRAKINESSIEYLKEKSVVTSLIWAQEGCDFILYPAPILEAVKETRKKLLNNDLSEKAKWVEFTFERVNMRSEASKDLLAAQYHYIEMIAHDSKLIPKQLKTQIIGSQQTIFEKPVVANRRISKQDFSLNAMQVMGEINTILIKLSQDLKTDNKQEKPFLEGYFFYLHKILEKLEAEAKQLGTESKELNTESSSLYEISSFRS